MGAILGRMSDLDFAGLDLGGIVQRYWALAEARDWSAYGELLADDVIYEMPQTLERIEGKERYLRFNREYPGDWHISVQRVVADRQTAASWVVSRIGAEIEVGISFFDFDGDGRITKVTDFWPQPYEPPPGREHLVDRYR